VAEIIKMAADFHMAIIWPVFSQFQHVNAVWKLIIIFFHLILSRTSFPKWRQFSKWRPFFKIILGEELSLKRNIMLLHKS
jgi:hypothetical protein